METRHLKISVIIPCYNMGRFLPECLSSIERQSYPDVEVIVIDGGSTDNTREVVKRYAHLVDVFISEPDNGQADAVTKGLKLATGDVHHWHAADDIVMPGAFLSVSRVLASRPEVMLVISDGWAFDDHALYRTARCRWISYDRTALHFSRFQSDCAYWRRELTPNALPLDAATPLIVDEDFFLRLWCGKPHAWLGTPLGAFRMHGDQVSQRVDRSFVARDREASRRKVLEIRGWSAEAAAERRRATLAAHWVFDRLLPRTAMLLSRLGRAISFDLGRKHMYRWFVGIWLPPLRLTEERPRMVLQESITIMITTRNRRDDLAFTLERLLELGLAQMPLIVVDDASDAPILSDGLAQKFSRLKFVRNDSQQGLIANRNKMTLLAETPYVLSLDDDSCFRDAPDLQGAVAYLERQSRVVGLQFNNVDVNFDQRPVAKLEPYRVQSYTGCGHLLKRTVFLRMGGYRSDFVHMGEEVEFCRKAWKAGWEVHMYPRIIIDHRRTPVARFPKKNIYYLTRNLIIINYLHIPFRSMMPKLMSIVLFMCWKNLRRPYLWGSVLWGWLDGIKYCVAYRPERVPMTGQEFDEFRRAPATR
jgi:glycosyltransferase involved in cell wall biosynthesis